MRESIARNLHYWVALFVACPIFLAVGFAGVSYAVAVALFFVAYLVGKHSAHIEAQQKKDIYK